MNHKDPYPQFKSLFQQLYDPLVKYAYTLLADDAVSEDLVQDVFVRIWEKHRSVIDSAHIRPYLYKAVRNACLNYMGAQKKMPTSSFDDSGHDEEDTDPRVVIGHDDQDEVPDYRALLQKAIGQLPKKCREIFLLSRSGQLSNQEIADHLGISIKTVNNQTWKAMKLLKALVHKAKTWLWPLIIYFFQFMIKY